MKITTKISFSIFAIAMGSIFVSDFSSTADGNLGGAPGGRAGDPLSGNLTCAAAGCHIGPSPIAETGWITSTIPVSGYKADSTYTITAKAVRAGHSKFGFEVSPQNATGTVLGTLIATSSTETQLVTGGKYITHKIGGITGTDSLTWTFDWTAPATGLGPVTFYGAFNASNGNGTITGDTIFTSTTMYSEDVPTFVENYISSSDNITIYPNPVVDNFYVNNAAGTFGINVVDVNGRVAKAFQNVSNNEAVNIADLAAGIYTISIESATGVISKKIVKN